jgi:hypothetical protein
MSEIEFGPTEESEETDRYRSANWERLWMAYKSADLDVFLQRGEAENWRRACGAAQKRVDALKREVNKAELAIIDALQFRDFSILEVYLETTKPPPEEGEGTILLDS